MADAADLTVQILREIRDAVLQTNVRLDQTNVRLDQTRTELSTRLDQTRTELSTRLGTVEDTLLELATQQRFMVRNFGRFADREEINDLRRRIEALEARPPSPH